MTTSGSEPRPPDGKEGDRPARATATAALLAGAAALGGFLFGYDSSVINGAVDAIQDQFGLSGFAVGFVVSSALLGCASAPGSPGRSVTGSAGSG